MKNNKRILVFVMPAVIFVICGVFLSIYLVKPLISERQYRNLSEKVKTESEISGSVADDDLSKPSATDVVVLPELESELEPVRILNSVSDYDVPEVEVDFDVLHEINADVYSWINIPDTKIDYPVLQSDEELDYYLDHNIDGSTGYPGCIYSQCINNKDYSDFNTVLYGHNMNAGTMFADLHKYEDPGFFADHPYVYIFTEEGTLVYQIFAASSFPNVLIPLCYDFSSEDIRKAYIETIYEYAGELSNENTDIEVDELSNILTLSTCVPNVPEKRFIVSAVLVADGRALSD